MIFALRGKRSPYMSGILTASYLALSCAGGTEPPLDPHAIQIVPPVVYHRWWDVVQSCSGLQRDFSDINWYTVAGVDQVEHGADVLGGYWSPTHSRIVLAGNLAYYGTVVRHEMLHALLRNVSGHPREYYLNRCGGVVRCAQACVADAGTAPANPVGTRSVTSRDLKLDVQAVPSRPSIDVDDGVFSIVVSATNTAPYPVTVNLDPLWSGQAFFYQLYGGGDGISESTRVLDPSATLFMPGETKVAYFDLSLKGALGAATITPGRFTLAGGFNGSAVTVGEIMLGN